MCVAGSVSTWRDKNSSLCFNWWRCFSDSTSLSEDAVLSSWSSSNIPSERFSKHWYNSELLKSLHRGKAADKLFNYCRYRAVLQRGRERVHVPHLPNHPKNLLADFPSQWKAKKLYRHKWISKHHLFFALNNFNNKHQSIIFHHITTGMEDWKQARFTTEFLEKLQPARGRTTTQKQCSL